MKGNIGKKMATAPSWTRKRNAITSPNIPSNPVRAWLRKACLYAWESSKEHYDPKEKTKRGYFAFYYLCAQAGITAKDLEEVD